MIQSRTVRALVCLAVAAAIVTQAEAALAARRVVITGGGWGHGLGMSQYGAYGRALNGTGASRILEHYYSHAHVKRANTPRRIRVGLLQSRSAISATNLGAGRIKFKVMGEAQPIATGDKGTRFKVIASPTGAMRLYKNGNRVRDDGRTVFGSTSHPLMLLYEKSGALVRLPQKSNNYAYGRLQFDTYPTQSCGSSFCLRLILALPMQKYIYGLGEVPASWPKAALKAQAIAGRTYALRKVRTSGQHRYPCDCAVYDSTLDQAYIGDAKRTGSGAYWDDWKRAVDQTAGTVVLYRGAPIDALYSSSSGGYTENNENVWGGSPIPYLRGVRDRADGVAANPNHRWRLAMSWSTFASKLNAAYGTGRLQRYRLVKPLGVSGRVTVVKGPDRGGVRIVGSRRTVRASGWSTRSALGLKDTLYRVDIVSTASAATSRREISILGDPTFDVWRRGRYLGATYTNGVIAWSRGGRAVSVTNSVCRSVVSDMSNSQNRLRAALARGGITLTRHDLRMVCG
jgi:SpoIID/LytB domain protein